MDRNLRVSVIEYGTGGSLSARRAWIEIVKYLGDIDWTKSLSARRAWIEIK